MMNGFAGETDPELERLRREIREKDEIIAKLKRDADIKLTNEEINRYSRQILVPNIGVEGQILLKKSSVLVVGAGGLGCPASLYLAGSGVGHIGIVDYDSVEVNNLHRQVLYSSQSVGASKVESSARVLKDLNGNVSVTTYAVVLDKSNAMDVIANFDVVIDATDNVATRYLLNDACVLSGKPLVSGSALKTEGQLTVYNHENGPCYRCLFPVPPPPETVTNCGDGGVFGPVPGVIGVLQALETMKIILRKKTLSGSLLLFDGLETKFRTVRLRSRNQNCDVCGVHPTVTELIDYEQFCRSKSNDKNPNLKLLPEEKRVTVSEYKSFQNSPHVLIDVRTKEEFDICRLEGSLNIPIDKTSSSAETIISEIQARRMKMPSLTDIPVFVVCRRGNDSQKAVLELEKHLKDTVIKDIVGGLHAWAKEIDPDFPVY
ncbi:UNVERIFIED_CONTAM: hypothetical protein PYX00_003496 [Menopon gallinae]|uniref:Adenylyltransferase and sulfurtransferase MOCS3 homolog n=1 Tax=Menopon gallinae TaxID=328185 RepID=A0AAW2I1B5_9NEOP